MATLTKQAIVTAGLEPAFTAADVAGDAVLIDQKDGLTTFLVVRNTNGATRTVTINDPNSQGPASAKEFDPDLEVVVDATTGETWIPLPAKRFKNSTTGLASWTYSAVTGVTVGVFYL